MIQKDLENLLDFRIYNSLKYLSFEDVFRFDKEKGLIGKIKKKQIKGKLITH